MRFRFFYIPVLHAQDNENELNLFLSQQKITNVEKQLIADGQNSFWSVCVTWVDEQKGLPKSNQASQTRRVDYKEVLSEPDFAIYAQLRDWRKEVADREGTPPYNVFTNEQLANMVQQRVTRLEEVRAIDGVGQTRADKYAAELVKKLAQIYT